MNDVDDAVFVDVPARPKAITLGFMALVFVGTLFGSFAIVRGYFPAATTLGMIAIFVVALMIAILVALTIAQLILAADTSRRRAVFVAGTEVGVRKGSDGFLVDLAEPHSAVMKLTGKFLTIFVEGGGVRLRIAINNFDEPELLQKFRERGMVSPDPLCCKGRGVSVRLEWGEGDVKEFLHRLLDLLWRFREVEDRT